jgi:hypothetical protein
LASATSSSRTIVSFERLGTRTTPISVFQPAISQKSMSELSIICRPGGLRVEKFELLKHASRIWSSSLRRHKYLLHDPPVPASAHRNQPYPRIHYSNQLHYETNPLCHCCPPRCQRCHCKRRMQCCKHRTRFHPTFQTDHLTCSPKRITVHAQSPVQLAHL